MFYIILNVIRIIKRKNLLKGRCLNLKKYNDTKVMVLGTLHGAHRNNEFYNYNHIFSIIENFNPEVIGVEIREEDLLESRYKHNYKILGFDWLGKDIEDRA